MADSLQLTTHELWIDGRQMTISLSRLTNTSLRLSWTLPSPIQAYAGAVVLLSEDKFSSINFPVDAVRYSASTNWTSPADKINGAHVVAAFYSFFGDDITQVSVDITNVDPNKIYYASIHASSNILQYYTIGTQSYPLESSRIEKASDTYAGSIPSSTVTPENPVNGQVYFDPSTNRVMVWNDQMSAWIQTQQDTVPVGAAVPINKNQLFFNTIDKKLRFFDGAAWVDSTAINTRIKMGATWAPFNSADVYATYPTSAAIGDFAYVTIKAAVSAPQTAELKFYSLGSWFSPVPGLVEVFIAGVWTPITLGQDLYGATNPPTPAIGDFFYHTSSRDLLLWNSSEWVKADTENEGAATTDKIGIGSDGSYDERLRLIKILKHQLGWPNVCVELSEEQFNVAIDNALDTFRQLADNAYGHRHISFTIKQGQSLYYLNDPRDKTDRIVNIIKIHRINQLGISSLSAETGLYAQAFFNQLYQGSNVDVLSIHLMSQLSETYEKIFAGNMVFTWDEAGRQLTVLRRINQAQERVVLEVVMERSEQELMLDRWCKQWIQAWAQSELWEMLGEARSKYGTLPGANGGITLNGEALLTRSAEQQIELKRQITDYEVGNGGINWGNASVLFG